MCVQVPVETRSGRRIPRGRSCCEPSDLGARKPIPILWKSSKCPQSVSLLSSFRRAIFEVTILDTGQNANNALQVPYSPSACKLGQSMRLQPASSNLTSAERPEANY